jgi:exodeoxyribonuclease VII small subunit
MTEPSPAAPSANPVEIPEDIAALGFEEALAELDRIVRSLETGTARLDDSIAAYERGALLKEHCERKLRDAQARVDRIALGPDGTVTADADPIHP